MNTGKYTLKEFLTNHNLDQIIIPEIQRDYVWQNENVVNFLQSILDNSKRQANLTIGITEDILNSLSPEMREVMLRAQKEKQNYCNVGFIYAYSDPEMPDRYVLIDGQQRITTLFLILLALYVKENKEDDFKRTYFKNEVLKVDYKVREDSHEFLFNFVKHILDGNNSIDILNKYWYFTEYKHDTTIQSIRANYQTISNFINKHDLSLEYVEKYIEFWYFDTNKSKQGEELYLYMNSRGEIVSPNESIKANLLKRLSNQEKHEWGTKWENWQNLFWKYRQSNYNSDLGIEEFLKWIKIIELTKKDKDKTSSKLIEAARKIKDSKKINIEGLTLDKIDKFFVALEKILILKKDLNFNTLWLTGRNIQTIDYVKFIPLLMYVEKYPNFKTIDVIRFTRFFQNVTRFDTVSKNPYNSLVDGILLTNQFLENDYLDIVDLIKLSESYQNFLTDEEIAKLSIYKQSSDDLRQKIESSFWLAEDYKYCDGKIWLIWDCINFDRTDLSIFDPQKLSDFNDCFSNFKTLFDVPTDLLRRALLTKGDYSVWDGYSTALEQHRYSFINEEWRWKEQLTSIEKVKPYKLLIKDYGDRRKENDSLKTDDLLNHIISDFLNNNPEKNWIYYFIKESKLLSYCGHKKICWSAETNNIALLDATRATTFKRLNSLIII